MATIRVKLRTHLDILNVVVGEGDLSEEGCSLEHRRCHVADAVVRQPQQQERSAGEGAGRDFLQDHYVTMLWC